MSEDSNSNNDKSNEKNVNKNFSIKTLVENKKVRVGLTVLGVVTLFSIIGFTGSKLYQRYQN